MIASNRAVYSSSSKTVGAFLVVVVLVVRRRRGGGGGILDADDPSPPGMVVSQSQSSVNPPNSVALRSVQSSRTVRVRFLNKHPPGPDSTNHEPSIIEGLPAEGAPPRKKNLPPGP